MFLALVRFLRFLCLMNTRSGLLILTFIFSWQGQQKGQGLLQLVLRKLIEMGKSTNIMKMNRKMKDLMKSKQ